MFHPRHDPVHVRYQIWQGGKYVPWAKGRWTRSCAKVSQAHFVCLDMLTFNLHICLLVRPRVLWLDTSS